MKLTKQLALLLILILIAGCNEYEKVMEPVIKAKLSDQNPNPIFDGFPEPAIPDPKENDKTLLGIDSDDNGIRDDIDIWINRTGTNYNERMALRQVARAYREEWIVGNMIYELYQKGPVKIENDNDRKYIIFLSERVQTSATKSAEASGECLSVVFKEYESEEKVKLRNDFEIMYSNTNLRYEARKAYWTYNHTYGPGEYKKNRLDYCNFNLEKM